MQELGVSKDIADRLRSKHIRRLLEEHRRRVCTTELLGAEVRGRTGRRAQGKQGSQEKDWGRSGDLKVHIYIYLCVYMRVQVCIDACIYLYMSMCMPRCE